uniref:Uncharacterized protein n=1 Tax=Anguilla anguilla TaxID=7936 RepID=A0A0E9UDG4_ANGAN
MHVAIISSYRQCVVLSCTTVVMCYSMSRCYSCNYNFIISQ